MVRSKEYLAVCFRRTAKVLVLTSFSMVSAQLFAGAALTEDVTISQSDGTSFIVVQQGDEWINWLENEQGYTVAQSSGGQWFFVSGFNADRTPILSNVLADNSAPSGFAQGIKPSSDPSSRIPSPAGVDLNSLIPGPTNGAGAGPHTGPLLFILAEFDDRQGTTSEAHWANMLNNNVADYYDKVSYGNVNLTAANETFGTNNNGVIGWVNAGPSHPNTASNTGVANRVITRNAIIAADPFINYASYDDDGNGVLTSDELSIIVIVAGFERSYSAGFSPMVWGHAWCLFSPTIPPTVDGVGVGGCYEPGFDGLNYAQFGEYHGTHTATMGIIVHEIGHLTFALPDLYDIDGSSLGIGGFGVMGSGSWGRAAGDSFAGQTPVHPTAFTKVRKGWVNAKVGTGIKNVKSAAFGGATSDNTVYRINTSNPNQYFLVENRNEAFGYDRGLNRESGSANDICGVAIWHIDDSQFNNANENNRWVDLEEADNFQGFPNNTDMFYNGNSTVFNDTSSPNSKLYNNANTGTTISQISKCGINMTVNFSAPLECNGEDVTIMGTIGYDNIVGTAGPDVIAGLGGNDIIKGLAGNDTICGNSGRDTIFGDNGSDWIFGGDGNDAIIAGNGNDTVFGGNGRDDIKGGAGADNIRGQVSSDIIDGGLGDDIINGDAGNDVITGQSGADVIYGSTGNDTIDGGGDEDLIYGGSGADNIKGAAGDDLLYGGAGADSIEGGIGDDMLFGQNGTDTLEGGFGDDEMIGGASNDTCIANPADTKRPICENIN